MGSQVFKVNSSYQGRERLGSALQGLGALSGIRALSMSIQAILQAWEGHAATVRSARLGIRRAARAQGSAAITQQHLAAKASGLGARVSQGHGAIGVKVMIATRVHVRVAGTARSDQAHSRIGR